MKIIKASYEILGKDKIDGKEILKDIERVGRTCYKSEENITEDSAAKFVRLLIKNGHEAMIEHNCISIRFICDRGITHELARHRLASFAQESTRYCNYSADKYSKETTVIQPYFWDVNSEEYAAWYLSCLAAEKTYISLLERGATPQEARSVLPNSLKTEMVMTMNIRELRHFFFLRCAKGAHPQMRELTLPLLRELSDLIPVVFDDLKGVFL
jgi:thymidylate synthase (FAD)